MKPYSDAGEIDRERTYVAMQTRLRIVVRVPAPLAKPGADLPGDFEPTLRQAVADALVGLKSGWSDVDYVAPELLAACEALAERIARRQPCCTEARYTAAAHLSDCPYLAATKVIARARGDR